MTKCINREIIENRDEHLPPFLVSPKEPLQAGPHGVDIRILVRSSETDETDYQYACVETALAPRTMGPSPHQHENLDGISLVLEGTLGVMVEDAVYEVLPGGIQMRPRGLVHSFWNAEDEPLRFLDMFLNQDFDEYLEEFFGIRAQMIRNEQTFADPDVANRIEVLDREFGVTTFPEKRRAIAEEYGLTG
jgi:quercetin dioxygenase-like cupin family protein